MDKREFIIPVSVFALSGVFMLVCIAVFLTQGKSAKWVARKMKIGALLLTLSPASCNKGGGIITCYVPAPVNMIILEAHTKDTLKIKLDTSNVLKGSIYGVTKNEFSFALINEDEINIQKGSLVPDDGNFDTETEKFNLVLDKNLNTGFYDLQLFETNVEEQENSGYQLNLKLQITDQ